MTPPTLTDETVLQAVSRIVADVLDCPGLTLTPATTASQIDGWDSIAHVQIVVAIEKAFGFRFRTGEMATLGNVGALAQRIRERTARP
jgi:acyl carrier protein